MSELAVTDKPSASELKIDEPAEHREALAWSEEKSLDGAAGIYYRRLHLGITGDELAYPDPEDLKQAEVAIEAAPSLDEALKVVDALPDTNMLYKITCLEKVFRTYGDCDAVTDRIGASIAHTDRAIAGEVLSVNPNDAVRGAIKALDITNDPELKEIIADLLDSGITIAEQNGQTEDSYSLDPIVAASALEVVADIRRAASTDAIAANELFEEHSKINRLYTEREALIASQQAQLEEIDKMIAAEQIVLNTITPPKRSLMTVVRSAFRFAH